MNPSSQTTEPAAAIEIARKSRSNLAATLFWMPRARREDMHVFYAFCRLVDDDADDEALPAEEKQRRLSLWLAALSAPQAGEHACMQPLRDLLRRHGIPVALLAEIVDGVRMDVEPRAFADFDALRLYSHRVAGVVGLVSTQIFGCTQPESRRYAESLGQALQLTNILRDIGEDWRNGERVYLPEADMAACGYSRNELAGAVRNEGFRKLMQLQSRRAWEFYQEAAELITPADRGALFPARLMAAVYQKLLKRLQEREYPVFGPPLKLSSADRMAALASVVLGRV